MVLPVVPAVIGAQRGLVEGVVESNPDGLNKGFDLEAAMQEYEKFSS